MWKTNLVICVTIVALVAGYFFYQVQKASEQFRKNSSEHSKVLAAAVELNIRNAILSNDGLELVITDFLRNSARFVFYLNSIETFSSEELSAFAKEAGLAGITIVAEDGSESMAGPEGWGNGLTCSASAGLQKHEAAHLYSLVYMTEEMGNSKNKQGCVIVGFAAEEVEQVQKNVSVENLLTHLSQLPGIVSVQLMPVSSSTDERSAMQLAKLVERNGTQLTETHIRLGNNELIVAQRAGHFAKRMHQMRTEFFIFVGFLLIFGAMSSWWLYHAERLRIQEARDYEQEMARQHEEAALGRAAATIAHEIRNPLNAIGMGLQRLQLETEGLAEEHYGLLVSMREAVKRSNTIVTNLQQYVRSFEVSAERVDIVAVIQNVIRLYTPVCEERGIDIVLSAEEDYTVPGDVTLLGQVFENLMKNTVEAQPAGGYCHISVEGAAEVFKIVLKNGGFNLSAEESSNLFEPYFTSKTQGTGLGLAISRKIIEAHGGTITARPDILKQELTVEIALPC
jgi:signal transduction histidine kinase